MATIKPTSLFLIVGAAIILVVWFTFFRAPTS